MLKFFILKNIRLVPSDFVYLLKMLKVIFTGILFFHTSISIQTYYQNFSQKENLSTSSSDTDKVRSQTPYTTIAPKKGLKTPLQFLALSLYSFFIPKSFYSVDKRCRVLKEDFDAFSLSARGPPNTLS